MQIKIGGFIPNKKTAIADRVITSVNVPKEMMSEFLLWYGHEINDRELDTLETMGWKNEVNKARERKR